MKIEAEVSRQLLLEILTTAIEYSCTYGMWGQVFEYKWEKWFQEGDLEKPNPKLDEYEVLCYVREVSEDEDEYTVIPDPPTIRMDMIFESKPWVGITLHELEEAFSWAYTNYNHLFGTLSITNSRTINQTVTDVDYDAIGADVILQKIVLGEVTYG